MTIEGALTAAHDVLIGISMQIGADGVFLTQGILVRVTGDVTVDGLCQDPGRASFYLHGDLIVNGSYANQVSELWMASSLGGSGSLTNGVNNLIKVSNTCNIATLDATANPNWVSYGGSVNFVAKTTTYHHLIIHATAGKEDKLVRFSEL